jgi:hypothetical protein
VGNPIPQVVRNRECISGPSAPSGTVSRRILWKRLDQIPDELASGRFFYSVFLSYPHSRTLLVSRKIWGSNICLFFVHSVAEISLWFTVTEGISEKT